ncbi:MAG: Twitching motility protein [Desulfonauticus sp. 38_4375]|nr:MAG: Twitching motility protein [Desulfonauticus sp. 38_4375]
MLKAYLDYLLLKVVEQEPDLSDIILTPFVPIKAAVFGEVKDVNIAEVDKLTPFQIEAMAMAMIGSSYHHYPVLQTTGACDFSYVLPNRIRFRVNVFYQKGSLAVVMRKLAPGVPTIEELKLPKVFYDLARERFGLILVTGGTGTGKSTSLAAVINEINRNYARHIITLEDPIEFFHPHLKSVINQRELGQDFKSFAEGLRSALRQAPHIILVGEIRDKETVTTALEAAETGHLVLGTLHTSDAGQTIHRITGLFSLEEENLIRGRLAESLKYVISQRIMPKVGGGRIVAFEVMRKNLRIRELILHGEREDRTFYDIIAESEAYGMFTFDQCLASYYEQNLITEEVAMQFCSDRSRLKMMLDKIKAKRGEKLSDIDGLELDLDYEKRAGF